MKKILNYKLRNYLCMFVHRKEFIRGVFDFRALQGLAREPGSGQPQPSSGGYMSLFDSIAPNDPDSAENVFDLLAPVVWLPCT
jgi:hypothetical protein